MKMLLPPWRPDFASSHPIFWPVLALDVGFNGYTAFPEHAALTAMAAAKGLKTLGGQPLHFVPAQSRKRKKRLTLPSYEQAVHATGGVPTRGDSWHDFFNALSWILFPATKAQLVSRTIATSCVITAEAARQGRVRNREQERMAMFDEGGLILIEMPGGSERAVVFGHAIWESAMAKNFEITALTLRLQYPENMPASCDDRALIAVVDQLVSRKIEAGYLASYDSTGEGIAKRFNPPSRMNAARHERPESGL